MTEDTRSETATPPCRPEDTEFLRLSARDVDDILALEQCCFSMPWSAKQFNLAFEQQVFHVFGLRLPPDATPQAQKDDQPASTPETGAPGRLVAYVAYYHTEDEMEILNLAVDPAYRRLGLASRLMRLVLQISRNLGIQNGYLEVRRSNEAARTLYRRMGFEETGVRPRYYPDNGEDAILMHHAVAGQEEVD